MTPRGLTLSSWCINSHTGKKWNPLASLGIIGAEDTVKNGKGEYIGFNYMKG